MAITYTWAVTGMKVTKAGTLQDYVVQTYWTKTGTDESGNSGTFSGAGTAVLSIAAVNLTVNVRGGVYDATWSFDQAPSTTVAGRSLTPALSCLSATVIGSTSADISFVDPGSGATGYTVTATAADGTAVTTRVTAPAPTACAHRSRAPRSIGATSPDTAPTVSIRPSTTITTWISWRPRP